MKKKIFIWVSAVLLLCSLPAGADEVDNMSAEGSVLETMVVTAGRVEEKKQDVTTNITVITEDELKLSPAKDLGDLLAQQGFMIREYPNSLVSVSIRGFRTETHGNDLASHVLILVNGRRAGTGNLAKIMMDNVQRVEIIRGPGSVQYGASAMGGIVNVITKEGDGKPSLFVEGTLGSWEYQNITAGGSGKIKNVDFSFSASTESQDDYTTGGGDKYRNTGVDSKDRISFNAGWTFMPGHRVGVAYTGYEADGIGNPDYLSQNDLDDYVDHSIKTVDLVYDGQTTDGFMIWNLRYFQGEDEYETFDPEVYGDTHGYFRDTDHQGAQAQLTFNWDLVRITTGMDWTHYEISNSYTIDGEENTYDNPAAFLMAKTSLLNDRLVLSVGGRYDQYEVESDDGRSMDETHWSSSLGAVYKLTRGLSVRANYAEAFRMPTADELYMYDDYSAFGFGIWAGNPDLDPEKSKTYEVGIDYAKGSLTSGLTYFYTDFEDKISYAYDAATEVTRYENIEGATISGIEGSLQCNIGEFFNWTYVLAPYVSFTYLSEFEDEDADQDLQYTPEWTASYGVRLANPAVGFESKLNFSYVDEQDINDYEGTGEDTLDGYTVADLSISKQLLSFDPYGHLSIKADVLNLFDEDYEAVQGYPMPGRGFMVGLKYEY